MPDESAFEPDDGDEPETFTLPLPPPPFPAPHPHERDVVYFAHRVEGPPGKRAGDDIMLRRVPREVAQRFRAAAGARGMTHAQYLGALVALHDAMRARADGGDGELVAELDRLGLSTVSI
jgi:hypothetical protein